MNCSFERAVFEMPPMSSKFKINVHESHKALQKAIRQVSDSAFPCHFFAATPWAVGRPQIPEIPMAY